MRFFRVAMLASIASIAYGICDLVFSWNPLAAAPWLAHRAEPAFRAHPALAVGFVTECANGWIATLAFLLVEKSLPRALLRRALAFGAVVWGLWVVSGTATAYVWLDLPPSLALANLAFGLPKCVCIAGAIALAHARLFRR